MFAFPPADRKAAVPETPPSSSCLPGGTSFAQKRAVAAEDHCNVGPRRHYWRGTLARPFGITTLGCCYMKLSKNSGSSLPKRGLPVLRAAYSVPPGCGSGAMVWVVSQFSFTVVDADGLEGAGAELIVGNCADGRANGSGMGAGSGSFRNSSHSLVSSRVACRCCSVFSARSNMRL